MPQEVSYELVCQRCRQTVYCTDGEIDKTLHVGCPDCRGRYAINGNPQPAAAVVLQKFKLVYLTKAGEKYYGFTLAPTTLKAVVNFAAYRGIPHESIVAVRRLKGAHKARK